jgi:AcrR family transcriptional regulator
VVKQSAPLRREEILSVAVEQMTQRGISGTRAGDVAKAMGISTGLVFYHFGSKDQLIAEAFAFEVDKGLAELRAIVASEGTAVDRMTRALSHYGPDPDARGWRIWIDAWSESLRNDALRATIVRFDEEWAGVLAGLVHEGVEEKAFHVDDAPAAVARIMGMLDGVAVQAVLRERDDVRMRRAQVAEGVILLLGVTRDDAERMRAELSLLR